MPDSRSDPLKAAWARARAYAAEYGVSVRKARSILAKLPPEQKPKLTKQRSKPSSKRVKGASPDLAAAEKQLRAKYPHVIAGTLRAHTDGPHKGRRTVEISCGAPGCKNRRVVCTSDLFQCSRCLECAKAHRSERRSKVAKKGKQ